MLMCEYPLKVYWWLTSFSVYLYIFPFLQHVWDIVHTWYEDDVPARVPSNIKCLLRRRRCRQRSWMATNLLGGLLVWNFFNQKLWVFPFKIQAFSNIRLSSAFSLKWSRKLTEGNFRFYSNGMLTWRHIAKNIAFLKNTIVKLEQIIGIALFNFNSYYRI